MNKLKDFNVGDLVICTNSLWPEDMANSWPDVYIDGVCEVIKIDHNYLIVKAKSQKLIEYRNKLSVRKTNPNFESSPEGFFNLKHVSLNNKLLQLVMNA